LIAVIGSHPDVSLAQEVRGEVRDAQTALPVFEALVRIDPKGAVTVTDSAGWFELTQIPGGMHTIIVRAFGYRTEESRIQVPSEEPIRINLHPDPIQLPGIEVESESIETKMARVRSDLDFRLARLPGRTNIADAATLRRYAEEGKSDNWHFLDREMRVGWDFEVDAIRLMGRKRKPEVYLDDRRTWLDVLVETPLSELCRVELYQPLPKRGLFGHELQVPLQLRAYTCWFLAQVATGERELRRTVNFGDLIAGPKGGDQ
jgi:hypothetical protein